MSGDTVPVRPGPTESDGVTVDGLAARSRAVLEAHWRPRGYTVPNATVYPHQWLWDSCFHALVWAHLGEPDRATAELTNLFATQHHDGFVPHMTYWDHPHLHESFWGRTGESTITQPPMYGHAIAELVRGGVAVDASLADRAVSGLRFLLDDRRGDRPLVPILHPWESGCDDSPRWDRWAAPGDDRSTWRDRKGELVASLVVTPDGGSVANPGFEVESAAFNALVAFNARELLSVGFGAELESDIDALVATLESRWDPNLSTWRDDASSSEPAARTLEALLPVLVIDDPDRAAVVLGAVVDDLAYGGACGPAQVHRSEPAFDPATYWRGPAWPQLTYLLWVAARRHGETDVARSLAERQVAGVDRSGFAEFWHPDTGAGLGAIPQSWATLVTVMADTPD